MARTIDLRAAGSRTRIGADFRSRIKVGLLTSAAFGNAGWTASTNVARFMGPWQFAPIEPGISLNAGAISNSLQQPVYDTRQDVRIQGSTHFSPASTTIAGSIQVSGGRRVTFSGVDIGGATGGKLQLLKASQAILVEGIVGDFALNTTDQDGLVVGGCAAAKLTASISGLYMSVTARTNVAGSASTGDVLIGGTLTSGTGVTVGTQVVDFGKCNAIGSISGTTLTTTSETGAPILGGIESSVAAGMVVMIDGGVEVGKVSAVVSGGGAGGGTYTISNSAGISVPAGSRIFVESRGGLGSYLLNTSQTVASTFVEYYPPTPGYYGVPSDIPTDRLAEVALNYGPILYRQNNRILNTHGTNLAKTIVATDASAALNSATLTSVTMTGTQTCRVVLASAIAGINPRGAWTTLTAYAKGDAVLQAGVVYFCAQAHTSGTFATDLTTNTYWVAPTLVGGGNQNAATFKLANVGYNSQNLPVGYFNRDWHVTAITTGTGGAGTTIDLVCDNSYTGNLPPNAASGDVATYGGIIILMGMSPDSTKTNYLGAKQPGEHADSMGQTDKEKLIGFLGTDLVTGTSSYQAGGITSNSANNDTTEETSRANVRWVLGLIPGEDPVCNIVWSGMQQVAVTKKKRYYQAYADVGARTWVDPLKAPFPNATLRPTATEAATGFSVITGTDGPTSLGYMAYGGQMYVGGYLLGSPLSGDFAPAGVPGWTFSMASPRSYNGQRNPAVSEMLSLSFQNDTGDTLTTASAGTHIGWFDLSCTPSFPGALADGSRCVVDPVASVPYVGLGSAVAGRRAVRGRQAIPPGISPFYVDCTVRGTGITKRFGPYAIDGAPAPATTKSAFAVSPQAVAAPVTGASPYTFTAHPIGTASAGRDVYVAVELAWSTARTISGVSVGGIAGSRVNNTPVTSNNVRLEFWKTSVPTGTTGNIVVTTSGSVNAVAIYVWACTGVGVVHDAATAIGANATTGASVTLATPPSGAILAAHMYGQTTGLNRRSSAMTLTGTSKADAQVVSGVVTATPDLAWSVGTELTSGDIQVTTSGTGASLLSVLALGPAWAFDADMTLGTLANGTVAQAGSATAVTSAGVVTTYGANTKRFDYSLGILRGMYVEPARTNLCQQSQNTADIQWTVAGAAKTSTNNADPFGGSAALLVTADGTNTAHYGLAGSGTFGYTTGLAYTASCFVKAGTQNIVQLTLPSATFSTLAWANFDLANGVLGTVTGGTATISPVGGGWYRISLTATATTSTNANGGAFAFPTATNATRLEVNTLATNFYITGWQVEQAADASSYIPTTGGPVTRAADTLNLTGLSQSNGTYTARCWHTGGDFTDVAGVVVTSGAASLSAVATKPVQGISLFV